MLGANEETEDGLFVKTVRIDIPEQLSEELSSQIRAGWFTDEAEIARLALVEFVHRHRFELLERFQREDIAWAIRQRQRAS